MLTETKTSIFGSRILQNAATKTSYLKAVKAAPLASIRSDWELKQAQAMIDGLLQKHDLDAGQEEYLEVLSDLVEKYENDRFPIEAVSDSEILSHLLEAKGVSQADVAKETGIPRSTISEIVSGKRRINRNHIPKLADYFNVGPGVFVA